MLLLPINMNCETVTDGSVMRPPCSTLKLMVFTSKKCGECHRHGPPLLMLTTVFSVLSWSCHETTQHLGKNIWVNANKQELSFDSSLLLNSVYICTNPTPMVSSQ